MFIRKFRFFNFCQKSFEADNGGAGGTGGTGESGEEGSSGTGTNGEGSNGETGGAESGSEKTFTQADLDRVVNERLAREKKKYEGVDVVEYKRLKEEADAKAEAEKTELEKAQDKINKAESERQKAIDTANKRLILAEFKVLARDANIKYVDDAYRLADLSTVEVKEDGTISGIKEIVDSLIKEKPFLLEEIKGGTGKVSTTTKQDKGEAGTSFGARLGEMRKTETKSDTQRHYFK